MRVKGQKAKKLYKRPARKNRAPRRNKGVNPMINQLARTAGSLAGNFIVPGVGGAIGSEFANVGHHALKAITGVGDYTINKNSLMTDQVPQFSVHNRTTRVKHREYIADVISSSSPGSFALQTYAINPAVSATFPWLSGIAQNYEEYRIHGMIFEFKTMSADALNSTNTALGQVIMATQYNPLSADFINKQQMENYEFGVSTKPSCSLIHAIECQPLETPVPILYNRINTVSGSDIRLYDYGKFSIATNGMQAASVNLGELWISYDIELLKPKLSALGQIRMDHIRTVAAQVSIGQYFGALPNEQLTTASNMGCFYGSNYIQFPNTFTGNVMIYYYAVGNSGALVAPTLTPSLGASALDLYANNTLSQINNGGTSTILSVCGAFQIRSGGIIVFSGATFPANITFCDLYVVAIPTPMN